MRVLAAASLVVTCAGCTIVSTDRTETVLDPADAAQISQLVRASHPHCKIYHFNPFRDPDVVYVDTTCKVFKAVKSNGHWRLLPAPEVVTIDP